MEGKSRVTFDELDLKLLSELPLISEVLSSTTNKLVRFFSPIHQKIYKVCLENIPVGWEIDRKVIENVVFPSSRVDEQKRITELENFFQLKNSIRFVVKEEKKWLNYVEVEFGFYFDEDYEDNRFPYFYFGISRDTDKRFGGKIYPLDYYLGLKNKYSDYQIIIEHPEGGEDWERFEIQIDIFSTDKLLPASDVFAFDVLPEYLKGIIK